MSGHKLPKESPCMCFTLILRVCNENYVETLALDNVVVTPSACMR